MLNLTKGNLLITGARGFVGRAVLKKVQDFHLEDSALLGVRNANSIQNHAQLGNCKLVEMDLLRDLHDELDVATILHIAGEKRNPDLMWRVNYEGTRRLLEWGKKNGIKRFVYVSSVGVYGAGTHSGIVTAGQKKSPKNEYEKSKSAAEDLVIEFCKANGIEYVIAQPTNVIGRNGQDVYPLLGLIRSIKNHKFTYIGIQTSQLNYVAVEDVADALLYFCQPKVPTGIYIINTPAKLHEVVGYISKKLKRPEVSWRMPKIIAAVAAGIFSALSALTGRPMPFNLAKYRELITTTCYDGSVIVNTIDFKYQCGWEKLIESLIELYEQEGVL